MFELAVATDDTEEVRVEGMAPETYLERFAWDEAKYPPRRPLGETVSAITDIVQQLEDGLKVGTPRWGRQNMGLVRALRPAVHDTEVREHRHGGGRPQKARPSLLVMSHPSGVRRRCG
jgi:V-ATPase subunit C